MKMSKTLTINEKQAKQLYPGADEVLKLWLEKAFGKEFFIRNVIGRVRSFEEICEEMGKDPNDELPYIKPCTNRQRFLNAAVKLDIISEYLLDGVILDWTNSSQYKWYPWFDNYKPGAGFRFLGSVCAWPNTLADGGARLCVDTEEKAIFFGKNYLDIWNDFLNPTK